MQREKWRQTERLSAESNKSEGDSNSFLLQLLTGEAQSKDQVDVTNIIWKMWCKVFHTVCRRAGCTAVVAENVQVTTAVPSAFQWDDGIRKIKV